MPKFVSSYKSQIFLTGPPPSSAGFFAPPASSASVAREKEEEGAVLPTRGPSSTCRRSNTRTPSPATGYDVF